VIRLEVDWGIAIKVVHNGKAFILNVYTPYECYKNYDEYINRLGFISLYIKENAYTCIFIVGNMNADISDKKSLFGQHLLAKQCSFVRTGSWFSPARYFCLKLATHM
jgi:hypothetical protein